MSNVFFKGPKDNVQLQLDAVFLTATGADFIVKFRARFRRPEGDERKEIQEGIKNENLDFEAWLRKLVIGWAEVLDADNQPVEFSAENLDALLQVPEYLAALGEGFLTVMFGKRAAKRAREKNS